LAPDDDPAATRYDFTLEVIVPLNDFGAPLTLPVPLQELSILL
jgi:hypothetical protein